MTSEIAGIQRLSAALTVVKRHLRVGGYFSADYRRAIGRQFLPGKREWEVINDRTGIYDLWRACR